MLDVLMTYLRAALRRDGQALVEYALILALVSIVAVAVLTALGTNVIARIQEAVDALA
jgi:pilus assembly protein Flp/PilA